MEPVQQLQHAVQAFHYVAPAVVLLYYLITAMVTICTLQTTDAKDQRAPRKLIIFGMLVVILTYGCDAVLIISQPSSGEADFVTKGSNIYALSSALVWLIITIFLSNSTVPVWYPFYGSWLISLMVETCLLSLSLSYLRLSRNVERAGLAINVVRILSLVALLALYFGSAYWKYQLNRSDEESAPLLAHIQESSDDTQISLGSSKYGTTKSKQIQRSCSTEDTELDEEAEELEQEEKKAKKFQDRLKTDGNWWTYARGFSVFVPYIWPRRQPYLRLSMFVIVCCLLCTSALNVLIPRQLGIVVNSLGNAEGGLPFTQLGLYIIYIWVGSNAGLLGLKDWLYVSIKLHAHSSLNSASYNHIMRLSSDFHDSKLSGELYTSVRLGSSVVELCEALLFDLLPMSMDLVLACAYLYLLFGAYMALIAGTTMVAYLWSMSYFTAKQSVAYRLFVRLYRKEYQTMFSALGGWRTVSYFNRIEHERQRYATVVDATQSRKNQYYLFVRNGSAVAGLLLDFGLFGACFLAAYQVIYGKQNVGEFVTLITYWSGFTGPLQRFGFVQRQVQENLIDAEDLLQLFQTEPTIKDGPQRLVPGSGKVEFRKVSFTYDGKKQIIQDFNLEVDPGKTIALIGETGGGKSTILKLLFRFYDVAEGSILVNGQDIRHVTLQSLRDCFGVVPQDPSLFNETIMNNVRYAKLDATDDEVKEACTAAAIHDKILTFTKGYSSKVGEHGVKLSGGELQRIAIARAILKDPKIILLDEATSAVDSETEGKIQEALGKLRKGRTTFVVAHRLSTIMDADQILVIKDGRVLEHGPPKELLQAKGRYWQLWSKQMGINQEEPVEGEDREAASKDSANDIFESSAKKLFRPDAPEFIPRHQRDTSPKQVPESYPHGGTAHGQSHAVAPNKRTIKETEKKRPRTRKMKAKPDESMPASSAQVDGQGDGKTEISSSAGAAAIETSPKSLEPKAKRLRFGRRKQSKSEPGGRAPKHDMGDGASDYNTTPDGSGEAHPTAISSRRVSAPSDPPSEPANIGASTNWSRRRRQRHWRARNHTSSATQPSSRSGTQSTSRSLGWSTETSRHPSPTAHFTSPAVEASSSEEPTRNNSSSGVRFAPGV